MEQNTERRHKYDFTAICGCGFEEYADTLKQMRKQARDHLKAGTCTGDKKVIINRSYRGGEIDDRFADRTLIIDGKRIIETV